MGPAIKYHYNSGGFRVRREFLPLTSLSKEGKGKDGNPADTVVILKKEDQYGQKPDDIIIKAYPNPISDILYIEHFSWKDGYVATIKVQDAQGKQILEKNTGLSKESVNLIHVAPGSYSINYYINNAFIISWKIIKL